MARTGVAAIFRIASNRWVLPSMMPHRKRIHPSAISVCLLALLLACACSSKPEDPKAEAPPKTEVEEKSDVNAIKVDHPEQFPVTPAEEHDSYATLNVTGNVNPDISREIPVITLANGRVTEVRVRLGDFVKKGQVLMEVQSTDVSGAFAAYLKAVNDERLAHVQFARVKLLFDKGADSKSQMEIAENNEQDAQAALTAAEHQLTVLGVDKNQPSSNLKILAPASGVITAQNVTASAATGATLAGSPTAFTIADLSQVWVICDVYQNDLPFVNIGDSAEIHLDAYPDRVLKGTISDIGPVLDPALRTGKVRIQIANPKNFLRLGMYVRATFRSKRSSKHAAVPASAILHLHDRDWVYVPAGNGQFQRVEVRSGQMFPGNLQEVESGIAPGQPVVVNALELQNMVQ
jgi:cobalt-zinc-cadmium efflux system membrane fusion protein